MSKSPVVIEVTRGPLVESRHEGIPVVIRPDGTVVDSWGDIDARVLPRSANKPIQAMAFVESGAVEKFGLGNEHIALACAFVFHADFSAGAHTSCTDVDHRPWRRILGSIVQQIDERLDRQHLVTRSVESKLDVSFDVMVSKHGRCLLQRVLN